MSYTLNLDYSNKALHSCILVSVGKVAIFRAIVIGTPAPTVTWVRNKGEMDEEKYKTVYDASSGEHQLQVGSMIMCEECLFQITSTDE